MSEDLSKLSLHELSVYINDTITLLNELMQLDPGNYDAYLYTHTKFVEIANRLNYQSTSYGLGPANPTAIYCAPPNEISPDSGFRYSQLVDRLDVINLSIETNGGALREALLNASIDRMRIARTTHERHHRLDPAAVREHAEAGRNGNGHGGGVGV